MKRATGIYAIGFGLVATIALAHNGATGVVLERMQGMTAMRDVMRDLAPIIQGAVPYDALAVSEAGYVIASHSGDTMRALFPEGSLDGVTYAKPEIWADWQEFASLAEDLRRYGEALSSAAPIGLDTPAQSTAQTAPDLRAPVKPETDRTQEIATLMGYSGPVSVQFTSATMSPGAGSDRSKPGAIGAEAAFARISGTCSACHARFRKGRN